MANLLIGSRMRVGSAFLFIDTLAANLDNYDETKLFARATTAGWNGTASLRARIIVPAAYLIGSTSVGAYAFDTPASMPGGSSIELVIDGGKIYGRGGAGGSGAGGPALRARMPLIINSTGTIAGGGNGGANGAGTSGAAYNGGETGCDFMGNCSTNGGVGGVGAGSQNSGAGQAGGGGNLGGCPSDWYRDSGCSSHVQPGANGAVGRPLGDAAAVAGNSFITWVAPGTRIGAIT